MNLDFYRKIKSFCFDNEVCLVAVSKTKPTEDILTLYEENQRIFGENKVQDLVTKYELLPKDIEWHFIGHLQKNKVKYIAPFVALIHSTDSISLLQEINKRAQQNDRKISCLLQFHIAQEDSKFGFNTEELPELINAIKNFNHIRFKGVMGMASFINDKNKIKAEFQLLKQIFNKLKASKEINKEEFTEISMGMSGDYELAVAEGSTMIRIGSSIFGAR